jgi:hypothetical protein
VKTKGQKSGYGGIQCAESEAIVAAAKDGILEAAVYSLAYDQSSKQYKCACGSCKKNLATHRITDLNG